MTRFRAALRRAGHQVVRAFWLALCIVVSAAAVHALSASPLAASVLPIPALGFVGSSVAGLVLLVHSMQPRKDIRK